MKQLAIGIVLLLLAPPNARAANENGNPERITVVKTVDCDGVLVTATWQQFTMSTNDFVHFSVTWTVDGDVVGHVVSTGPAFTKTVDGHLYWVFPGRYELWTRDFYAGRAIVEVQGEGDAMTFTLISFPGKNFEFDAFGDAACSMLRL